MPESSVQVVKRSGLHNNFSNSFLSMVSVKSSAVKILICVIIYYNNLVLNIKIYIIKNKLYIF